MKSIFLIFLLLCNCTTLFAYRINTDEVDPLEALLTHKRHASKAILLGNVKLHWEPESKHTNGYRVRGAGAQNPVSVNGAKPNPLINLPEGAIIRAPTNAFITEFNLYCQNLTECQWAIIEVSMKNFMGIESGQSNQVNLKELWIGYQIYKEKRGGDFHIQAGRNKMYRIFDSRIQFDRNSRFDGILLSYELDDTPYGSFLVHGGPCIVDYVVNHYAWIGELCFGEIYNTGFFAKYSIAHWRNRGVDRNGVKNAPNYRFINSQILAGWQLYPEGDPHNISIYGAYEQNLAAIVTIASDGKKRNVGWYIAAAYGRLEEEGDFLCDICYQDVGYQAVPNFDRASIGRGNDVVRGDRAIIENPWDTSLYTNPNDVNLLIPSQAEGNTNFRGIEARAFWVLTEHLYFKSLLDLSWHKYKPIGHGNKYTFLELELVYGF